MLFEKAQIIVTSMKTNRCGGDDFRSKRVLKEAALEFETVFNSAVTSLDTPLSDGIDLCDLILALRTGHTSTWKYDIEKQWFTPIMGNAIPTLGISLEESLQAVHPDDKASIQIIMENLLTGKSNEEEIVFRSFNRKHGDYEYYRSQVIIRQDEKGYRTHIIGTQKNITEDVLQKRRLEDFKIKTNLTNEKNHIVQWDYDIVQQCIITQGSGAIEEGASMDIPTYLGYVHPDDQSIAAGLLDKMSRGEQADFDTLLRVRLPNYEGYRYIILNAIALRNKQGEVVGYTGIRRDSTEMALMDENIRASKFKTEMAIKNAKIVMWEYHVAERMFTAFNDPLTNYDETVSYTPEDYIAVLDPNSIDEAVKIIALMDRQEVGEFSFKSKVMLPNSTDWQYITIHGSHAEVSKTDPTKATKYLGFRVDNTELVKLSQKMEESNALTTSILAQSPSGIFIKDISDDWRYVMANDLFCQLFDYTESRIIGYTDFEIFEQKVADKFRLDDLKAVEYDGVYSFVEEIITGGKVKALHTTKRVIAPGNGHQLLIGITSDITETVAQQRELESRIAEAHQQQLALEDSNEKLNMALGVIQAFSWHCDLRDGKLLFDSNFTSLGVNPELMDSPQKFAQCIHPDDRQGFLDIMDEFYEGKEGEFISTYRVDYKNNGHYEWWECRGKTKTMYKDGQTYKYLYGMDYNITHHKQITNELIQAKLDSDRSKEKAEEANALLQSIIRQIPFGLYIKDIDHDFRYVIMNDVLVEIDGLVGKEVLGKTDSELFDKEVADLFHRESMLAVSHPEGELTVVKNTIDWHGRQCVYENSDMVITVANGRRLLIGVVADVTDQQHMMRELQEAKERAEQSDKLKSAFLANMSHEIRTPLNAIVGFSELLVGVEDPAEREEYTNIISVNNELLLRLIGDILDLSKIESGMIELKTEIFDLSEICDEMYTMLKQKLTNPDVDFRVDNPYRVCVVELDKNRLKQIGINFITNAIKYTASGIIKMGYEYVDHGIRIYVEDTGIGIAKENHGKVFERFEKFDSFAQGTGLGLSICKAIVDVQGGRIGFDSEEGVGSLFWAWFPCKATIEL